MLQNKRVERKGLDEKKKIYSQEEKQELLQKEDV